MWPFRREREMVSWRRSLRRAGYGVEEGVLRGGPAEGTPVLAIQPTPGMVLELRFSQHTGRLVSVWIGASRETGKLVPGGAGVRGENPGSHASRGKTVL